MRGLLGHFEAMPLDYLVSYLGNRRASGLLRVLNGDVRKEVHLREGRVVSATSNQVREYLGQFLVNMGLLTEDQFDKAYATQRETQVPLGKILVMIGLVTEEDVQRALALKFRETLLEAFTWPEGEFTYDMDVTHEDGKEITVAVDLLDIHREGQQRAAAWEVIRATFPSGDLRLELDEARVPEGLKPESLDGRLVQLIGDGQPLEELVRTVLAPEFLLYQRLFNLHRVGIVRVAAPQPPPEEEPQEVVVGVELAEEPSVDELVETAQSMLEQGNFRGGEAAARRAVELEDSPGTAELLRSAEAALLGWLRRQYLERPHVPALLVSAAQVKHMQLSAPQLYLLSRVDGKRELGTIVNSPLQSLKELEALKHFQDFVDQGLVKLTPKG
jgi:hypothetical protein